MYKHDENEHGKVKRIAISITTFSAHKNKNKIWINLVSLTGKTLHNP
jgi:hypothetical protein